MKNYCRINIYFLVSPESDESGFLKMECAQNRASTANEDSTKPYAQRPYSSTTVVSSIKTVKQDKLGAIIGNHFLFLHFLLENNFGIWEFPVHPTKPVGPFIKGGGVVHMFMLWLWLIND